MTVSALATAMAEAIPRKDLTGNRKFGHIRGRNFGNTTITGKESPWTTMHKKLSQGCSEMNTLIVRGVMRNITGHVDRIVLTRRSALLESCLVVSKNRFVRGMKHFIFFDHEDHPRRKGTLHSWHAKCRRKHDAVVSHCIFNPERT